MHICIIGAGTYGSYLLKRILEEYPADTRITWVEMGDEKTRNETEIGLISQSENSKAAREGRYFGLGGTSARWGGQVLFFDERDNNLQDKTWHKIIKVNKQYQSQVIDNILKDNTLHHFFTKNEKNVKVGLWLKYGCRNVYKHIPKKDLERVEILKNYRVTDCHIEKGVLTSVFCRNTEVCMQEIKADVFYLTAGAIESCRLLLAWQNRYGILNESDLGKNFGDHISVELFKIKKTEPILDGTHLLPLLHKGSLLTRRFIVESKNGRMGYLHPSFNREVTIFSTLKNGLFGKQKWDFNLKELVNGISFLIKFAFNILILKKMYAHNNDWSLQLDIEQAFPNENTLSLGQKKDIYGENEIQIHWQITKEDKEVMDELQETLSKWLKNNQISAETIYNPTISASKIEDVYHPVGFIRIGDDPKAVINWDYSVKGIANLYHFSTALFPSAKSINPTAAGFCFIEHHIDVCRFSTFRPHISPPISMAV